MAAKRIAREKNRIRREWIAHQARQMAALRVELVRAQAATMVDATQGGWVSLPDTGPKAH